ncbi:phytanoyl-CoA dioxygenase family protein [Flavitalea sp. BT771]|uniref:phytanoyl-CoA dioxygenase family protein n=1 Tax=Flavitalea sp. BT771 TaxID=3063329 RepID=UPI0026E441B4|nr:phytanoyl-CoA dioxygenase family protein [Flavitalea sp. BT771]MDO6432840.1 phytanoyl-CoA dioxygenase family protein [Flavitalea sp. BT771]MDV6221884.1 phytanoyl-CoA dioxygenase family protein [Flavitalea sp. BT771]
MSKKATGGFYFGDTLTHEQTRYFDRHGIIQFKSFIDKATVKLLLDEIAGTQRYLLDHGISKVNGIPLKFGQDVDGSALIQRIAFASHYNLVLKKFLQDPRLAALTSLLGDYQGRIGENEKDGLVVNHYVNTPDSAFRQLGWHTDSPRDLFLGRRIRPMLNVGLHLDDCPFENGGLRVLPGTHKQGLFRLLFRKKYFIDNNADAREVGFDIAAGDLTVHDGRIWHRVQQSPLPGAASRRRVMYIPIITGDYQPKSAASPTPFYHKLAQLSLNPSGRKISLAALQAKRQS